jgi:hypothetical protein
MNGFVILMALFLGMPQDAGADDEGILPSMSPDQAAQEALVQRIKENLAMIDQLLLDASDADDVRDGLDNVRTTQVQVVRDLEELIKAMKYQQSQQSSGGGGGQSQDQPQGQPPPRENDGSQSEDQQQSGEQPQSPQEQAQSQADQQQQDQQQPQDGLQDTASPQNQPGGPPPPDELGEFTREDTDDRWGLLPPKLQERLLNLHVDDVPERYRLWLEAYIRSMHRLESGDDR